MDEKYSDIAMSKLETIPTVRSFLICDIYGTMVEIFFRLIPLFIVSPFSIQTELCH